MELEQKPDLPIFIRFPQLPNMLRVRMDNPDRPAGLKPDDLKNLKPIELEEHSPN